MIELVSKNESPSHFQCHIYAVSYGLAILSCILIGLLHDKKENCHRIRYVIYLLLVIFLWLLNFIVDIKSDHLLIGFSNLILALILVIERWATSLNFFTFNIEASSDIEARLKTRITI